MTNDFDGETDVTVARYHAANNFQQLVDAVPPSLQAKEAALPQQAAASTDHPLKKLTDLYAAMDELGAAVAPYVACKRGCSACCHYAVHLFPIEATLIETWTGATRVHAPRTDQSFHGTPCPFLTEGVCSIYAVRPFVCRANVALTATAYWCQPTRSNTVTLPQARFSAAQAALELIAQPGTRNDIRDIREVFPTGA